MLKRFTVIFSILLIAVVLTACPTAGTSQDEPVLVGTIPANSDFNQDVLLQSGLAGDLIYFELGKGVQTSGIATAGITPLSNLELHVQLLNGKKLFSNRPNLFSDITNVSLINTTGIIVDPDAKIDCRGPCVIESYKNISSDFKVNVKIKNNNSFAIKFELFAFVTKSADKNEPNNSSAACTNETRPSSSIQAITPTLNPIVVKGARETTDDIDCFTTSGNVVEVTLATTSDNSTGVRARIRDKATNSLIKTVTISSGGGTKTVTIASNKVNIFIDSGNEAAPAKHSSYTLTY